VGPIIRQQFVSKDSYCFRSNISCYIKSFPSAHHYDCLYLLRPILTRDSRTHLNPGPVSESSHTQWSCSGLRNVFTTDLTFVFGVFCVQQVRMWNIGTVSKLSCVSINDITELFVSTYIVLSHSRLFSIHFDIRCSHFKKYVSIDAI
jgi:hypothetical protein